MIFTINSQLQMEYLAQACGTIAFYNSANDYADESIVNFLKNVCLKC